MMGTLGRSLGRHLAGMRGRFSLHLPDSLRCEADAIVSQCATSTGRDTAAVVVLGRGLTKALDGDVDAADLLAWRTDDDRVFLLVGEVEPDSSFDSSVIPFVTTTFPGADGGECSQALFARVSVGEAVLPASPGKDVAEAFEAAATIVFEMSSSLFREAGTTSEPWTSALVRHWARVVSDLDDAVATLVASASRPLMARDAWNLFMLAGLPFPGRLAGQQPDPNAGPPGFDEAKAGELPKASKVWSDVVSEHLRSGGSTPLLDALKEADPQVGDLWGKLDWAKAGEAAREGHPAPVVGRRLAGLGKATFEFGSTAGDAWWHIDTGSLEGARKASVGRERDHVSPCDGAPLLRLRGSGGYVLDTTVATEGRTTATSQSSLLAPFGVLVRAWPGRAVPAAERMAEGDVTIVDDPVLTLSPGTGVELRMLEWNLFEGEARIVLGLKLKFGGTTPVRRKWRCLRKLEATFTIRERLGGTLRPPRQVRASVPLVVPSPFWPTVVLARDGKVEAVSPEAGVEFLKAPEEPFGWVPEATPDLEFAEACVAHLTCHDGTLGGRQRISKPVASLSGTTLAVPAGPHLVDEPVQLGDEDALLLSGTGIDVQVAVTRIQDSTPLATNRLRAQVKGALGSPSPSTRATPLGSFETAAATAVSGTEAPQGLFQLAIPAGTGRITKVEGFGREATFMEGAPAPLPGLGRGPSEALAATPAWTRFLDAVQRIGRTALGGKVQDWLSAIEPSLLTLEDVVEYTSAHADLVGSAATPSDRFWARYPFSVIVVEGIPGPARGTLQAVFLSPMHPARLAWYFSVNCHMEALADARQLVGFCEGWNIPATGTAPSPFGRETGLVAVPLDPGNGGDLTLWSALVPEGASGVLKLPRTASGSQLPWGGRSGLNDAAIRQAFDDYTRLNPFVTSLQVELRSAMEGPRSVEVDRAVMSWTAEHMARLGGTCRIVDSPKREGTPPTRDQFQAMRSSLRTGGAQAPDHLERARFSWIVGDGAQSPDAVDVAFVENASPYTCVVQGEALAATAALPLRRYPVVVEQDGQAWYHYATASDDAVGLAGLLRVLEPIERSAVAVVTTPDAIEGRAGVRWEVVGDVNLEPSAMASVAAQTGGRQLWEWRPGWMRKEGAELGAVRGAHYVLAQVPRSLKAGLGRHLYLTDAQIDELLSELGTRGIGMATLRRPGTSQEAEAAGLFYASRVLTGFTGCALPPAWAPPGMAVGLLPVDPFHTMLQALSDSQDRGRADLVVVMAGRVQGRTRLRLVPVEVKFRGGPATKLTEAVRRDAREQARQTSSLLAGLLNGVAGDGAVAPMVRSLHLQGLATLVELGLKFAHPAAAGNVRGAILQDLLDGVADLSVGEGVALWFLPGTVLGGGGHFRSRPGRAGDGEVAEASFDPNALAGLLWTDGHIDEVARTARAEVDAFLARAVLGQAIVGSPIGGSSAPGMPKPRGPAGPAGGNLASAATLDEDARRTPSPEPARHGQDASDDGPPDTTGHGASQTDRDGAVVADERHGRPASPAHVQVRFLDGKDPVWLGAETSTRGTLVGLSQAGAGPVALDLDQPKAIGVFGYMGSGKSYLLGALVEAAAFPIPGLNALPAPMAVVVFNYRRNAADRFELASLALPNDDPGDVARLRTTFGAEPAGAPDVHVVCLPGELARRADEYTGVGATELLFRPCDLDVEDWELLMGEPGSEAVFARVARNALHELRAAGRISIDGLRATLERRLSKGSMAAAELRLEQAGRLVSEEDGVDFGRLLRPGRVLVIDLRQPMFNAQDASKLILVCANQIAKQKGKFNRLVVFDEAHEYMNESFGARFDARIRYMRHEGTSYVFATQDVSSVPVDVRRHLGTQFVFSLETRDNIQDMVRAAPDFEGLQLQHLAPGTCYAVSNRSTEGRFRHPRLVSVRPRATSHGGKSTIFSGR